MPLSKTVQVCKTTGAVSLTSEALATKAQANLFTNCHTVCTITHYGAAKRSDVFGNSYRVTDPITPDSCGAILYIARSLAWVATTVPSPGPSNSRAVASILYHVRTTFDNDVGRRQ
jgi:hypothetical protein